MKKLFAILCCAFVLSALVLFTGCSKSKPEDSAPAEADKQSLCSLAGGAWKTFPNGCADSCQRARAGPRVICTEALVDSCDCGPEKCWDGSGCELN